MIRIPLIVRPTTGSSEPGSRRREPVTFGVPLPRGAAQPGAEWCIGPGAESLHATARNRVQTRALDCWPDGSVRWMLVDAQIDCEPALQGGPTLMLETDPGSEPGRRITIAESPEQVVVDTGAAAFKLDRSGHSLFADAMVDGRNVIDPSRTVLAVIDADGKHRRVEIGAVAVEERGDFRTSVHMTGRCPDGAQAEWLEVEVRLDFFAGSSAIRCRTTIRNPRAAKHAGGFWDLGDPGSILLRDFSLTIGVPGDGAESLALVSRDCSVGEWERHEVPLELYQDSSGGANWKSSNHINRERCVPNSFCGYRLRSVGGETQGARATPIVSLIARGRLGPPGTDGPAISIVIPAFWENFPMAVEAGPDALRLRFLPHQYSDLHEIQGGEQKTYECFLAFGSDTVTQHPLEWCRNRAVVCADPEWTIATGAVPFLAPLDGEHAALVQVAIEGPDRFERKREIVDEYGWRHFGDIYGDHEALRHEGPMPLTSHYNNQYDPVAGFASQFLRTGNPAWWRQCAQLAAHVVDVDVYHTTRDKAAYNHGLFWHTYHYGDADTATHRTYPRSALGKTHGGGPSADHNYTSGLLLHYFLTGDEASRQTVMDLAQYVIDLDDGRKTIFRWLTTAPTGGATSSADGGRYHGPGRGPANSLNALVDGYRLTGRADFLAKAEELIRRVVHPADDIEGMELREPERRWFYTMFLQSLGKYLWYKHELGQHDRMYRYARASLLHYARWMAEHEYPYLEKPDKLEFPTETWAAQDIRKSDVLFFAAMHVSTSDRGRLLERAEFFHRRSVEQLQSMPTRIFARPIIVLLTSGFMRSWRERGFANLSASGEPADDFGQPSRFVAQRIVAMKRAKAIAAAVLVVALVAVAATLWALAF